MSDYSPLRLHNAIGYGAPKGKLEGREREIFVARDRKLHEAREARRGRREAVQRRRQIAEATAGPCGNGQAVVYYRVPSAEDYGNGGNRPQRQPRAQDRRPGGPLAVRPPLLFGIGIKAIDPPGRKPELLEQGKIVNTGRSSPGNV